MRGQLLAGATVLALAAGVMTSAMAFDQNHGKSRHNAGRVHARTIGGMHHFGGPRHRLAGASGFVSPRQGGWESGSSLGRGGFIDLGPLGFTTACGSYYHRPDYCGQGYSVDAWSR
ncbi:hypothetical protein [Bradyrhizobium sp.]|uniref:hypothetical protein n=1 Tax=Bradyrhizobium sp. TaxID=376 RepID=UPI00262C1AB2|nr:hypothetical protein [Bradyrhizobium sp.]